MLYDPKWEVKADPLSLEGLIAWLETMPANGNYDFSDCKGGCLIGLYGAAADLGERWHEFHRKLFTQGQLFIASAKPWTFGAALERARAL